MCCQFCLGQPEFHDLFDPTSLCIGTRWVNFEELKRQDFCQQSAVRLHASTVKWRPRLSQGLCLCRQFGQGLLLLVLLFFQMFNSDPDDLDMHVIYDVSHNIAKMEQHMVDGKPKTLLVHRKGSTRAFPPNHPLIPVDYQVTSEICIRWPEVFHMLSA